LGAAAALTEVALALVVVAFALTAPPFDAPEDLALTLLVFALLELALALLEPVFAFEPPVFAFETPFFVFEPAVLPLDFAPADLPLLVLLTDLPFPLVEALAFAPALDLVPFLFLLETLPLVVLPTLLPLVVFPLPFAEAPLPLPLTLLLLFLETALLFLILPFLEPVLPFEVLPLFLEESDLFFPLVDLPFAPLDFRAPFELAPFPLTFLLLVPLPLVLTALPFLEEFRPLAEIPFLPFILEDARPLALALLFEPGLAATFLEPDLDFEPFVLLWTALGLEEPLVILLSLAFETNLELALEEASFIFVLALAYEEPRPLPVGRSLTPLAARLIDLSLLVAPAAFFRDPTFALSDPNTFATLARIPPLAGSCEPCGFCEGWGFGESCRSGKC
jgi:hypothetical protein